MLATLVVVALTAAVLPLSGSHNSERLQITPGDLTFFFNNDQAYLSKLTDPIVLLTAAIVISNILLWLSTRRSVEISRKAFEQKRPWVFVTLEPRLFEPDANTIGSWWRVSVNIVNHGDMPGIISMVQSGWSEVDDRRTDLRPIKKSIILGPERSVSFVENIPDGFAVRKLVLTDDDAYTELFYNVAVAYTGPDGFRRTSSFYWKFDQDAEEWSEYRSVHA